MEFRYALSVITHITFRVFLITIMNLCSPLSSFMKSDYLITR